MLKRLLFVVIIAYGAYATYTSRPVEHNPGILVKDAPNQRKIVATPFTHKAIR